MQGPSNHRYRTIYRSQGKIPEIFLRGAGVPEDFIVYMRSLVGKAIEFYSCFISYSTKDGDLPGGCTPTFSTKVYGAGLRPKT